MELTLPHRRRQFSSSWFCPHRLHRINSTLLNATFQTSRVPPLSLADFFCNSDITRSNRPLSFNSPRAYDTSSHLRKYRCDPTSRALFSTSVGDNLFTSFISMDAQSKVVIFALCLYLLGELLISNSQRHNKNGQQILHSGKTSFRVRRFLIEVSNKP